MGVSLTTRKRWFARGADALMTQLPGLRKQPALAEGAFYICPLCISVDEAGQYRFRVFREGAIDDKSLTAEHVPPRSFGGRELVLTCASCNNTAGAHLDSHARKRENVPDVFAGRPTKPLAVNVTVGGHRLSARLAHEDGVMAIKVNKGRQKPGAEAGFRGVLQNGAVAAGDITLNFHGDAHSDKRARASWLRTAYLALFSVMGYRYIFQPGLEVVRRQIRDPETEHIPVWMITLPGNHEWTERAVLVIHEPAELACPAVRVGSHLVLLPPPGDDRFYDRLAAARDAGGPKLIARGTTYEWPREPSFAQIDAVVTEINLGLKASGTRA